MTPEQADWIAATVLTRVIRDSPILRVCPCQYGPCGHCAQLGNHDQCTTKVGFEGEPPGAVLTYMVARDGGVVASVWASGRQCRWVCPCPCPAPEPPPVEQLGLFDPAGAS